MPRIPCPYCERNLKTESGLRWHVTHAHANKALPRSSPPGVLPCSEAAIGLIAALAERTGLARWEAVDLVVAAAMDHDVWESIIDVWDTSQTGAWNAPMWLPLRLEDYRDSLAS